jgi:hypothetical protein
MFNSSNDRAGLCTFVFEDGRHCNMPHTPSELRLCYFHEKRELQRLYAVEAGNKIGRYLATNLHTACDLSNAFATLFRAGLQGHFEPKMLNSLTRLGQLLMKMHLLAKEEYLDTYENEWSSIVLQSIALRPDPEPKESEDSLGETPADAHPESNSDAQSNGSTTDAETQLVAPGLPRRPSAEQPSSTANMHSESEEEEEAEPTEEEEQTEEEPPTGTNEDPDVPPETGTNNAHPQPSDRQLLRYIRYLQRHTNLDQPQSHRSPRKISGFTNPPVTPSRINRFFNSPTSVNHKVITKTDTNSRCHPEEHRALRNSPCKIINTRAVILRSAFRDEGPQPPRLASNRCHCEQNLRSELRFTIASFAPPTHTAPHHNSVCSCTS